MVSSKKAQIMPHLSWHLRFSPQAKLPIAQWRRGTFLVLLAVAEGFLARSLPAQIVPAADNTNTQVTVQNNQFDIQGGMRSQDGANLFHSFQDFGLNANQVANFLADPQIQNILGRVTGGNPSIINGLIQLTGSNANLFLMNPAGMVFGTTASLNVPSAFTATTATSIGLDDGWFHASGTNNYSALVGQPHQFAFTFNSPGSIINAGHLAVAAGQDLRLIAGNTLNTGQLSAPGGNITVAAVTGGTLLRLSQEGVLLNLEIDAAAVPAVPQTLGSDGQAFHSLDLPQLLTLPNVGHATGINVAANGAIQLAGSGLSLSGAEGAALVSGTLDASNPAANGMGGMVNVLGDRVGLVKATIDASGFDGGGTVRIGGDYQGKGPGFNASRTFVSQDSILRADADLSGDGGQVILWSEDTTEFYGDISAQGGRDSGNGGFVEVSGKENLYFQGTVDVGAERGLNGDILLDPRDIIIESSASSADDGQLAAGVPVGTAAGTILFAEGGTLTDFTLSDTALTALTGNIILQASRDIIVQAGTSLNFSNQTAGETITFQAGRDITVNPDLQTSGGSLSFSAAGSIAIAGSTVTSGGNVAFTAALGSISTGAIATAASSNGGAVTLSAPLGNITTGTIDTTSSSSNGGAVSLTAPFNPIQVSAIDAQGNISGGNVALNGSLLRMTETFTDRNGITTSISTAGGQTGGNISLSHKGGIANPFVVGDASVNGSAAALTTGANTLSPTMSIPGNIELSGTTSTDSGNDFLLADAILGGRPANNMGLDLPEFLCAFLCDPPLEESAIESEVKLAVQAAGTSSVAVNGLLLPELNQLEDSFSLPFEEAFDLKETRSTVTIENAKAKLKQIEQITGVRSALIYIFFSPSPAEAEAAPAGLKSLSTVTGEDGKLIWQFKGNSRNRQGQPLPLQNTQATDPLTLMLVTADGDAVQLQVPGATRQTVQRTAQQLVRQLTDPRRIGTGYLMPAQRLYQWLVAPLAAELQTQKINNLTFLMDTGLRTLPVAALHDGETFIIEDYSLGLMPSLALTDTDYVDLRNTQVLAMGAAEFDELKPLPAVPVEVSAIADRLWQGRSLLNEDFTLDNLQAARQIEDFGILHLATHADFRPGISSYIQLWKDQQLTLKQLKELELGEDPPVELLVLSACRTAFGDPDSELGFAGLAVLAGVKSALGSLWYVSDDGTLGLMATFYEQLQQTPVKAEALRQAQLAMLQGKVRLENGQLITPTRQFSLTPELAALGDRELSHPFFWSAFTIVGNPW